MTKGHRNVSRKCDHVALEMALQLVLKHEPDLNLRQHVKNMLAEKDGWYERFA
jgi:hypothetical protein